MYILIICFNTFFIIVLPLAFNCCQPFGHLGQWQSHVYDENEIRTPEYIGPHSAHCDAADKTLKTSSTPGKWSGSPAVIPYVLSITLYEIQK